MKDIPLLDAAESTVEALMYELRTDGMNALLATNCQRRLNDLSPQQIQEVIDRLKRLRPKYPNITDGLISHLQSKLPLDSQL